MRGKSRAEMREKFKRLAIAMGTGVGLTVYVNRAVQRRRLAWFFRSRRRDEVHHRDGSSRARLAKSTRSFGKHSRVEVGWSVPGVRHGSVRTEGADRESILVIHRLENEEGDGSEQGNAGREDETWTAGRRRQERRAAGKRGGEQKDAPIIHPKIKEPAADQAADDGADQVPKNNKPENQPTRSRLRRSSWKAMGRVAPARPIGMARRRVSARTTASLCYEKPGRVGLERDADDVCGVGPFIEGGVDDEQRRASQTWFQTSALSDQPLGAVDCLRRCRERTRQQSGERRGGGTNGEIGGADQNILQRHDVGAAEERDAVKDADR